MWLNYWMWLYYSIVFGLWFSYIVMWALVKEFIMFMAFSTMYNREYQISIHSFHFNMRTNEVAVICHALWYQTVEHAPLIAHLQKVNTPPLVIAFPYVNHSGIWLCCFGSAQLHTVLMSSFFPVSRRFQSQKTSVLSGNVIWVTCSRKNNARSIPWEPHSRKKHLKGMNADLKDSQVCFSFTWREPGTHSYNASFPPMFRKQNKQNMLSTQNLHQNLIITARYKTRQTHGSEAQPGKLCTFRKA